MATVDDVLARGRVMAESLMQDTCTIRRRTGTTTGPGGVITPIYSTIYSGRCRFQQTEAQAVEQRPGGAFALMLRMQVQLPMSVTGLRTEDEVVCDSSAHDPDLPGRSWSIRDLAHKTHASARRVGLQERTS